jgi:hypothetical protein
VIEGLKFDVSLNSKNFEAGIKSMSNSLKGLESGLNRLKNTVLGLVSAWASFTTIKKSINLFAQQEQATLKLAFATQRFTKNAKQTFDTINQLADSMQETIGVGNEYVQNLAAIGLSYGIFEEKITQATEASILLSKIIGTDAQTIMRGFAQTLQGQLGILGRYIPELRNLSDEQLRSGAAIDYVVNRFSGLKEALGGTTQANLDKIKSYLGDIGEYLGSIFAPAVKRTADIVKWFATALADPQQAIETIKQKIIDFYNSLSPIGKAVLSVAGAFLGFQIAVGAWNLLVKAIGLGGAVIVKTFQTIFSWPFLLAFGASVIYAAWHDNWFGIRDLINNVWQKIEPIFMAMWNWITKSWKWTVNIVGEGWEWIKNVFLPLAGQVLATTWNWLINISEKLFNFVKDIAIPWLGKTVATVWKWLTEFAGNSWNFLNEKVFPFVGKAANTIWTWTVKFFGEYLPKAIEWVGNTIGTAWQWIINFVGEGWKWLTNKALPWIGHAVETAWNWLIEASGKFWDILGDVWDWIGGAVATAWDWTLNMFDNLGKGLVWIYTNILKPLAEGTWNVLKTSWDFALNIVSGIAEGFVWFYTNILKPLGSGLWNVFKTTWEFTTKIATNIGEGFKWFYDNVLKPFAVDTLKTVWDIEIKRAGEIEEIFNNIKADIENQDWQSLGFDIAKFINTGIATSLDIVGAIATGIKNAFVSLRQGLGGVKESLINFIKETLASEPVSVEVGVESGKSFFDKLKEFAEKTGISEVAVSMVAAGIQIGEALKEGLLLAFDLAQIIGLAIGAIGAKFYKEVIEPLGKKIAEHIGEGLKAALDFVSWIGTKIKELWNSLIQLGKDIGNALIEGIKTVFSFINPLNWFKKPTPQEIQEWAAGSGGGSGGAFSTGGFVFYQTGGFTPDIGTNNVAGVVHGGEWVAPAWMVKKYKAFFDWLELVRQRGYQTGGFVNDGVQIGSKDWFSLPWEEKIKTMFDSYTRVWGENINLLVGYIQQLADKMGLELPQEVMESIDSLNNLDSVFGKLGDQLGEVKSELGEFATATTNATKELSQSAQVANSALQSLASHIEWLSYSNGGLKLDLGAGIGNFINILLGGVPQIFPVLNWVFNPFSALANFILDMLRPKPKEPEFTQEEPTTYGQTFVAGTPKEVVYNFNVVFKENVLLTEDENAQKRLFEAFVRYVQEHGGTEVVFG